jgi:predicted RNase H-like HicB family nuclease
LPEVITEGDTESEALTMAKEAIALAIEHRRAKGFEIPVDRASHIRKVSIEEVA